MQRWVSVQGKMRPAVSFLKTLPTLLSPHPKIEGWDLKMDSPKYRMRYFVGGYFDPEWVEAVTVEMEFKDGWQQIAQYDERDYGS